VGDAAGCDGGVPPPNSLVISVAALAPGAAVPIVVVPRRASHSRPQRASP
jgi:hypothetical protein